MTTAKAHGDYGENLATEFLRQEGYEILERNFRHGRAEIDIIAIKNNTLHFVEVKTRSGTTFGQPEEFVNPRKVSMLKTAAENYVFSIDWHQDIRFDIAAILISADGEPRLEFFPDAFS